MLSTVLLIICVVLLVGMLPTWGAHTWGYYPSGGIGIVLVVILLLLLLGYF